MNNIKKLLIHDINKEKASTLIMTLSSQDALQDPPPPTDVYTSLSVPSSASRFTRYAWFVLGYLGLVILWGAWVRISGSGAGCGAHWPTCNGVVVPLNPTLETLIEYTHRLTSGLSLPLVFVLVGWSFRRFPAGSGVRGASLGALFFLLTEAALGAGLVKFELVAGDTSVARAVTASFHLVNTFALSAFSALVAWWSNPEHTGASFHPRLKNKGSAWLIPALVALIFTSMTGAITALGDTLFPTSVFTEQGLVAHLAEQVSASTHFLVQLRIVHPIVAVLTSVYLLIALPQLAGFDGHRRLVNGLEIALVALGFVNILLAAPAWMQLVHLLSALTVWLSVFLLWVRTQSQATERQTAH